MQTDTPTPTQALEPVEVTQAARKAAADLLDEVSSLLGDDGIGQVADLIRDGEYDEHDATLAFARFERDTIERHRQSSNAASVGVDAAKAALAKLGWRIENRGGADIRVGEDWCSPATDSDTLMFNALSGIASLSTPTAEPMADIPRKDAKHVETLNWLSSQYLPGGPYDVKGAIRAAIDALTPKALCQHGHTDPMRLCNDCEANTSALSDLQRLGQEYDGDALREALAHAREGLQRICARKYQVDASTLWVDMVDDMDAFAQEALDRSAIRALSATPATTVEETERLREALEKIAASRVGLQGIQEDYGHDTNAYNFHAMKYWAGVCQQLQWTARAALSDRPQAEGEVNRG